MAVVIRPLFFGEDMTIPAFDRQSQLYVGNGENTRFDFSFRVFKQENTDGVLVRVKQGNEWVSVDPNDFEISLNIDNEGGYVEFKNPPDSATFFYIVGNTANDQLLDITNYDNFYPDALERALDKITAILIERSNSLTLETQSRILADLNYEELSKTRDLELKNYIDSLIASVNGDSLIGVQFETVLDDVASLENILKWNGRTVFVKSYHDQKQLGGGHYIYDISQSNINNGGTIINGWVLKPENNTITPYHFGWTGKDLAADMDAFQKCFDAVKNGQTIRFWHTAHLEKQINKHTDIYGTEGRSFGRLTMNGGQPCLILRQKKNVTIILEDAEIYTETACLGLIDLYKCRRCVIKGGTLTGGNYIRETGEYKFPPIDGTTGHAEKGALTTGFNTTVLSPDIGGISNNMVVTQAENSGGYGGAFPQYDGTTATTWGIWRGGQLGNHSDGVRVIGGYGNEILGSEIHGFNGSAIRLGLLRSPDGLVNYPRISNSDSREVAPKGTKIKGTYLHNCYIGGCQSDRSIDTFFDDFNIVEDMGHPNASIAHTNVDPGYGFSTSRSMPNFKLNVKGNTFTRCFRKGIDCHQGSQLRLSDNTITGTMFHGVGIAIDDDFADTFYQPYFEHVGYIKDNQIESHEVGIFYANGQFGRGRRETSKLRWEQLHVNITGNTIKSTNPFFYNFAHSPFYIAHNTFFFAAPYAYQKAVTGNKFAVGIGSYAGRGYTAGDIISHNKFFNSKDGNFAYMLYIENGSNQTKATKITENHFDVTPWSQKNGADSMYLHNDVVYRSGSASSPIVYSGNLIPQDAVIEANTVWNDFNHDLIVANAGGGTGFVGYPIISGDGRVTSIQVLSGGTGYSVSTTMTVRAKSRGTGATLTVSVTDGVITSVNVVTGGRFYRSSYNLSIPRGLVSYDMMNVSGASCHDKGIGSNSDTGCILSVVKTDLTAPDTPFLIESSIRYMQTKALNQYAIHSGGINGGSMNFWLKVPSQTAGTKCILSMTGSVDMSNNAATSTIEAVITGSGYTLVSGLALYVDSLLYAGEVLSFTTPYHIAFSSPSLIASSIIFGAYATLTSGFLDAKFAYIEIHRAGTYTANGISDLFSTSKALFGK